MEQWRPIEGISLNTPYSVSNNGRVRNDKTMKCLDGYTNKYGYNRVGLNVTFRQMKKYLRHRLIAKAFIPNPYNLETVNHKDGVKLNNHVDNLEWMSRSDNTLHGWNTGLIKSHDNYHMSRGYTDEDLIVIKRLLDEGLSVPKIHKQVLQHMQIISLYCLIYRKGWKTNQHNRKTWDHARSKRTEQMDKDIMELYNKNVSVDNIIIQLNLPIKKATVERIITQYRQPHPQLDEIMEMNFLGLSPTRIISELQLNISHQKVLGIINRQIRAKQNAFLYTK